MILNADFLAIETFYKEYPFSRAGRVSTLRMYFRPRV